MMAVHASGWFSYARVEEGAMRGSVKYVDCVLCCNVTEAMGLRCQFVSFHDDAVCTQGARLSQIVELIATRQLLGWMDGDIVMDLYWRKPIES